MNPLSALFEIESFEVGAPDVEKEMDQLLVIIIWI